MSPALVRHGWEIAFQPQLFARQYPACPAADIPSRASVSSLSAMLSDKAIQALRPDPERTGTFTIGAYPAVRLCCRRLLQRPERADNPRKAS